MRRRDVADAALTPSAVAVEDPVSSDDERPARSTPSGSATPSGKKGKARRRLLERERARKAGAAAATPSEPVPSKPAESTYAEAAVSSSSQADPVIDAPTESVAANGATDVKHDRSLSMSTERPVAKRAPPSSIDGDLSDATQWTTGAFSSTEDEGEADASVDEPKALPSTPPQRNGAVSDDPPATPIAKTAAIKVTNAAARGVSAVRAAAPNQSSLLPAAPSTPRANGGRREREPSATGSVRGRGEEKSAPSTAVAKPQPDHGSDHAPATKRRSIIERTVFGFAMIGGFIGALPLAGYALLCANAFSRVPLATAWTRSLTPSSLPARWSRLHDRARLRAPDGRLRRARQPVRRHRQAARLHGAGLGRASAPSYLGLARSQARRARQVEQGDLVVLCVFPCCPL